MDDRPGWFDALSDRYRYVREIGRGGMACVHLVEDLRYHRQVALKVLRDELAHAVAHDRFIEEIRVAARLNHPNVVPLYDSGVVPAGDRHPALPWFTMMYIAGESLRERLARGPLPVPDAVDIARAVAGALDYAHGERVIHRDIKPGNILLAGEVPVVADFGIARALDRSGGADTLTSPGLAIGTAHYISPEQAGGEPVDERSDVYSLGCVVYEMLAGHPPFTGPTPQAIIARHNLDPPPPLGTVRPSVPPAAVAAVEKALAKKPPDRWPSAGAFAHALRETTEHAALVPQARTWRYQALARRHRLLLAAAAMLALAAATVAANAVLPEDRKFWGGIPAEVQGRYVVFPFSSSDTVLSQLAQVLVSTAMGAWDGVSVADPIEVRERLGGAGTLPPAADDAARIARRLGAEGYVHGGATPAGDSIRISATLYETSSRRALQGANITIPASHAGAGESLRRLADSLLVRGGPAPDAAGPTPWGPGRVGTRSLPAWQEFARGVAAIDAWDLTRANSAFGEAWRLDEGFAQAALWFALTRSWMGQPTTAWRSAADRARSASASLSERDRRAAWALFRRSEEDLGAACSAWDTLRAEYPGDFMIWYGLADCLLADDAVIRNPRSPSGFAFRTSREAAIRAYRRANRLHPPTLHSLGAAGYAPMRMLFLTHQTAVRFGRGVPPDTAQYAARAGLAGDTLALVPYPLGGGGHAAGRILQGTMDGVHSQRRAFYLAVAEWVATEPDSPDALEAMAGALDMLGAPGALDTLRRARFHARSPRDKWRLASTEVWLLVKGALPTDTVGLAAARNLADSLLGAGTLPPAAEPFVAACLASLIGKASLADSIIRRAPATRDWQPPLPLAGIAPALLVYATIGAPVRTIERLEDEVASAIERRLPSTEQRANRARWLAFAAALAYPVYRSPRIPSLAGQGDYVIDAISAVERGDLDAARAALTPPAERRARLGNAVTLDALPGLAVLHAAAFGPEDAIALIDISLGDLSAAGRRSLEDPTRSGSLTRALLVRAELAEVTGARAAAGRWRQAAATLWAEADPAVKPLLGRRMLRRE